MRAPAFWWQAPGPAAALLRPFAAVYGAVAAQRLWRQGARAALPVVCIGDPTVGGAGKTPTALTVARLLADAGERPAFLTRGYGGRLAGPLVVDASRHPAAEVGDEPLLLAAAFPTIVARDRVAGASAAREAGASVIVMDDGFQNPSLAKNVAVLVIDGTRGVGNGLVFPAGPLRAPLQRQLAQAHAVVVIGAGAGADAAIAAAQQHNVAVFTARLEPHADAVAALRAHPVLAFAGIGNPEKFFTTLAAAGIAVNARQVFPDHHPYTERDAAHLLDEAAQHELLLVTTEKDYARLGGLPPKSKQDLSRERGNPVIAGVHGSRKAAGYRVPGIAGTTSGQFGSAQSSKGPAVGNALGELRTAARTLPITLMFDAEAAFRALLLSRLRARV
jgi:tetraacyldisaccharide 4'-kinase